TGDEDADDYPTVADPEGLRNALVEGAEGAILHGKKYKFRKEASVGAFVTAREGESKNESAAHHQILTPGWVTMGHELGHAAHMRGGATTMATPTIMQDITGRGEEELNATWQNSEELVTIRGWENALRTDVGLTTRASHIPYDAGKKIERYYSIYSDMKATYPHPFYLEIPDMKTFKTDLQRANNSKDASVNLENDVVYADLQRRWAALRTRFNVADLRPIFMRFLQPVRDRVVRKYTAKKLVYDGKYKIFMKKTKKQAWQTVVTNYTAVMDDYDNHLDAKLATLPGYQTFKDKLDTLEDAVEETTF
ncbi:MAG TPA: hypothetical protein VHL10_03370, partial [Nitrososphaera sp.]|nr:hypothetical protein [Nitrososphaera sp.]